MTIVSPTILRQHLDGLGIAYRHLSHSETRTSAESAAVRGEPLENGAKALVMKVGDEFHLFVLSAARKADSGEIKRRFGVRSVRFATPEELLELTGLVPGSVPPFGEPILPLKLHLDEQVRSLDRVAFNAASLTESIIMATPDYIRAASPTAIFAFSAP
jgi:prolyl-tRNA editing enzyme YbaK/EbsC (Cys-tRNA(Pro) deacylase)